VTALYVSLAAIGFMAFLAVQPKVKALISFFLMMQFFDMAPNLLFGMYVWDYGAILMLVTAVEVFLRKPIGESPKHGYLTVLKIFLMWLLICLLWSLLVYQYPLMHTIKNARYVVLGYFMTLIFIRLFSVQPGSFEFLMQWFYRLTFVLMPVVVLQYVLHKPLLFGLASDYEGVLRYIPAFLPFCLLNFWIISAKALSSEKPALHEFIYMALTLVTVALTFTRGIYMVVIVTAGLLVWNMFWDRTLKASSVILVASAGILLVVGLMASGAADRVVGRAVGGLELLNSGDASSRVTKKDDTFNGRLGLAAERFSLAWAQNPVVGYGFIHEDDVPSDLRKSLKYGTPLGGTAADPTAYSRGYELTNHYILGLYTSDIGWADIVISTGWVGVLLLAAVMLTFVSGRYRKRGDVHPMGQAVGAGLYLQVVMMFLLMFDGNYFYSNVHIPAFLLAGYALTRVHRVNSNSLVMQTRPANLMT
jgi:hypothetical protein